MTDARTLLDKAVMQTNRYGPGLAELLATTPAGEALLAAAAEADTLRQRVAALEGTLRALHGIASSHGARTGHDLSCTAADCYVLASLAIRAALTPTPDR